MGRIEFQRSLTHSTRKVNTPANTKILLLDVSYCLESISSAEPEDFRPYPSPNMAENIIGTVHGSISMLPLPIPKNCCSADDIDLLQRVRTYPMNLVRMVSSMLLKIWPLQSNLPKDT
jgi:hypothetical protein